LLAVAQPDDLLLEVQGVGSPTTLLRGRASEREIRFVAAITAHYSDADADEIPVACGASQNRNEREIVVVQASESEIEQYRL
jgi:predicted ribosome quality control (RQC) complex YloA/Tae2 family protein